MVFGSVSFWCVRCLRYTACPEGVPSRSTRLATEQDLRKGPQLAGGRSPHFEEARRQIVGRRACVRRAGCFHRGTLSVDRKAHRKEPLCSTGLSHGASCRSHFRIRKSWTQQGWRKNDQVRGATILNARLSLSPSSSSAVCRLLAWKHSIGERESSSRARSIMSLFRPLT